MDISNFLFSDFLDFIDLSPQYKLDIVFICVLILSFYCSIYAIYRINIIACELNRSATFNIGSADKWKSSFARCDTSEK